MYTDIENQINYADQMKSDLIMMQTIKIKLFQSKILSNETINNEFPRIVDNAADNTLLKFVPITQMRNDVEIVFTVNPNVDQLFYQMHIENIIYSFFELFLINTNVRNLGILTPEELAFLFSPKKKLFYNIEIFSSMIIVRF